MHKTCYLWLYQLLDFLIVQECVAVATVQFLPLFVVFILPIAKSSRQVLAIAEHILTSSY